MRIDPMVSPSPTVPPPRQLNDVIILPFNNTERALELLEEHAEELACVLLDPMPHRVGMNPIEPEFLTAMRDWTKSNGSLLVFDEVITYRSDYGGLQMTLGVEPDLTAMGKMIGGGFPVGGVAGRADVMDLMNPKGDNYVFPYSGTFSANPISMTAGHIAMRDFDRGAVKRLNKLGDRARQGIAEAAQGKWRKSMCHRNRFDSSGAYERVGPTKFPGGVHLPRRNRTTQSHARSPVLRGHDHDQHLHRHALDADDRS